MRLFCLLLMLSYSGALLSEAVELDKTAETVITYIASKQNTLNKKRYGMSLLTLALDKTIKTHGAYRIETSPKMNKKRALATLKSNELENFFYKHSISKSAMDNVGYVNFPVDLGIVGFRVFFVSPESIEAFKDVNTLEDLKKFSIGQGVGWLDTEILRHNGFKVIEGTSYEGVFKMVTRNRVDLFGRGANELLYEYQDRIADIPLIPDTSIILYYPLPRFFITNKENTAAIARIEEGLDIAYRDGSLRQLWDKYYAESVNFIKFDKAKIFKIENPYIKNIDQSFKKYVIRLDQLLPK